MTEGLAELFAALKRVTVIVTRSSFNWEIGQAQAPNLALFEDEQLIVDKIIDPRLLRAKRVVILATASDGGTAMLDLTGRSVQMLADTSEIRRVVSSFNGHLLRNSRSKWLTAAGGWTLSLLPLAAIFIGYIVDTIVNPRNRRAIYDVNTNQKVGKFQPDIWLLSFARVMLVILAVGIVLALVIGIIRARSGPLRIWPDGLTTKTALRGLYRMRVALPSNAAPFTIAVVAAILGALLGAIFAKVL
jgi:hypothetical protein